MIDPDRLLAPRRPAAVVGRNAPRASRLLEMSG
jgi:hypothetical protein